MLTPRVLVVGAGITGLSFAHELSRLRSGLVKITLAESSPIVGGWIQTVTHQNKFTFEKGPRSLSARPCPHTLDLIKQLNLQPIGAESACKRRFIYTQNQCVQLPNSPFKALSCPLTKHLPFRMLRDLVRFVRNSERSLTDLDDDPSVYDFFSTHLGSESSRLLADPMVAGIYAGDAKRLSMRSCFPSIFQATKLHHGSLIRAMFFGKGTTNKDSDMPSKHLRPMFSFGNGMTELPMALNKALQKQGVDIRMSVKVHRLNVRQNPQHKGAVVDVFMNNNERETFDAVFLTGSLPSSANLIDSINASLAKILRAVKFASLHVVSVGWHERHIERVKGFGLLVPSSEANDSSVLGVTFDSDSFPTNTHHEGTRMTVMLGGDRFPSAALLSKSDAENKALKALKTMLGISRPPDFIDSYLAHECIPQMYCGHKKMCEHAREELVTLSPNINVLSTAFHGVSVHDCIRSAVETAREFAKRYDSAP